jgi:hypothetical protein
MVRIPRCPLLAVARGMKKGNCSFFAHSARFSSGRGRILIYLETSSHLLRSPITFCPPRLDPFRSPRQNQPTLPSNRQISINRQTARKSFSSSCSLHCSDPASISPTPCNIAVFPQDPRSHCGAPRRSVQRSDRQTPLMGGGLPPVANLLAWNPTLLTYIWKWSLQVPSSMHCSSSICFPSTMPAPPFRSSLAPPDSRRAAWLSSTAALTSRPPRRPPRPVPGHIA